MKLCCGNHFFDDLYVQSENTIHLLRTAIKKWLDIMEMDNSDE